MPSRSIWIAAAILAVLTGVAAWRSAVRSGAEVITVGLLPSHIAVDSRTHHAFVTNADDHTVSMIDTRSGAVLSTARVPGSPYKVAVNAAAGRAFVLYKDGISLLDTDTGTIVRSMPIYQQGDVAVDAGTGHLFVLGGCDTGGHVYTLDARTGALLHTVTLGGLAWGLAVDSHARRVFVINSQTNSVSILDAATGNVLRSVAVGDTPQGIAVEERTGLVFVANYGSNSVSVLDARRGVALRTVGVGTEPSSVTVDPATDRVIVVGSAGNVAILDGRSGARLAGAQAGTARPQMVSGYYLDPTDIAVDERRGHTFILNAGAPDDSGNPTNGSVSVLDTLNGRVLRTFPIGMTPTALAVDEASGHLFVVSGRVVTPEPGPSWLQRLPAWLQQWLPRSPHRGTDGAVMSLDLSAV